MTTRRRLRHSHRMMNKKYKKYRKRSRRLLKAYKYHHDIINSRGEHCVDHDMTVCCPHMSINNKGQYASTNEMTLFSYRGKVYELHTCCKACAQQMQQLGDDEFERIYKPIRKTNYIERSCK